MSDEKKSFTVKDRRHFTAEGEARAEGDPAPPPPPAVDDPPGGGEIPRAAADEVSFAGLLLSLGAQASALLTGGEQGPHLPEARQVISLLEILKDKTEGRRTKEEEEILSGLLYELRMSFVARTRPGAP